MLALLYGIPYVIAMLVLSMRGGEKRSSKREELLLLGELREKQVLTEEEFEEQKRELLQ